MAIKGPKRLSFVGAVSGPPGSGLEPVVPDVQIVVPNLTMAAEQTIWQIAFIWEEAVQDFDLALDTQVTGGTLSNLRRIRTNQFTADLTLPSNAQGTGSITVLADAVDWTGGTAPESPAVKSFAYDTRPVTDAVTFLCTRTETYIGNPDLDTVLLTGEQSGGAFSGVLELVRMGDYIYLVVQIQKYVSVLHGPNIIDAGFEFFSTNPQAGAVLYRLNTTNCEWQIVKAYPSITLAARSLTVYNNRVYFIEGSHYAYLNEGEISVDADTTQFVPRRLKGVPDNWKGQIGHLYSVINPQTLDLNPAPVDLGLNYASALPSDSPHGVDRYYGTHGGTASPIREVNGGLTFVTGYGNLDKIDDNDNEVAKYENWQQVRYDNPIEFRLPELETNDRTGFDIVKVMAIATNSIVGFDNDEFTFRPRIPFSGQYVTMMSPQILLSNLNRGTSDYPATGLVAIGNELIRYNNFLATPGITPTIDIVERGAFGTPQQTHAPDDDIYWVDHYLGLDQSTLDQPIDTIVVSEDRNNIYNRVSIAYGGTDPFIAEDEDPSPNSLDIYGVREFSFSVPLGIGNIAWVGWLAKSILKRFKMPNSLINLQLKPSWHLKVGDIVFVKVPHRLNLQVPTQIVSVNHNVRVGAESAVTTTVQLLTL